MQREWLAMSSRLCRALQPLCRCCLLLLRGERLLLHPLLLFSEQLHLLLYCRQYLLLHDRHHLLHAVAGLPRSCFLLVAASALRLASTLLVE